MSDRPSGIDSEPKKISRRALFKIGAGLAAAKTLSDVIPAQAQEATPIPPEPQPLESPVAAEPTPAPTLEATPTEVPLEPTDRWREKDKTPENVRLYIENLIANPPIVGTSANAEVPLHEGIGYATYEFSETGDVFAENFRNRTKDAVGGRLNREKREPTYWEKVMLECGPVTASNDTISSNFLKYIEEDQSQMSPDEALVSGKCVGTVATREGADAIGKTKLMWVLDDPKGKPRFVGVALVIDNSGHTKNLYNKYRVEPWTNSGPNGGLLEWMIDASYKLNRHFVSVYDRKAAEKLSPKAKAARIRKLETGSGRPGVILLSEEKYREINPPATS